MISTADKKLNSFLIPPEEAVENFQNYSISEILRSLSNFEPISMKSHIDQPRNIDLNKY